MRYPVVAIAVVFFLWTPSSSPAFVFLEGDSRWQRAYDLARDLERSPAFNLNMVSEYLEGLFRDPETNRAFFSDCPESTSSLRQLIRALSAHAKQACARGDWERGEQAFGLVLGIVRRVLQLKPPEKVPVGSERGGKEVYIPRAAALVYADSLASAAVFLVTERLQQIAQMDGKYAHLLQPALQRAREIRTAQRQHASKILPLLRKEDYRQLSRITDEHLLALRSLIDKWEGEIMQSLRQIRASHR